MVDFRAFPTRPNAFRIIGTQRIVEMNLKTNSTGIYCAMIILNKLSALSVVIEMIFSHPSSAFSPIFSFLHMRKTQQRIRQWNRLMQNGSFGVHVNVHYSVAHTHVNVN